MRPICTPNYVLGRLSSPLVRPLCYFRDGPRISVGRSSAACRCRCAAASIDTVRSIRFGRLMARAVSRHPPGSSSSFVRARLSAPGMSSPNRFLLRRRAALMSAAAAGHSRCSWSSISPPITFPLRPIPPDLTPSGRAPGKRPVVDDICAAGDERQADYGAFGCKPESHSPSRSVLIFL